MNWAKWTLAAMVICAFSCSLPAQTVFNGIPEDWSHHHVVFSNPGTSDDAARKGSYAKWSQISNSTRFQIQEFRKVLMRRRVGGWGNSKTEALKTDWSMDLGSGATVGAGEFPAKYSFSTSTASCSDWVAYNTGATGASGGQANIVAFSNLYASPTCSSTVPSTAWAYFSGTGKALTSPIVSLDGSKIAYIENSTTTGAVLRIIEVKAGEGTAAAAVAPDVKFTNTTAGAGANKAWSNCTAGMSCMISVAFQDGDQDTRSAPFYEYSSADTLWVGDNSGKLHEFTGVFNGTPAEVVSASAPIWPIVVSTSTTDILTSPVYDSVSGNIFVADSSGLFYSYKASTAVRQITSSRLTATANTTGIVDGPMVDSSTEEVYVSVGDDANTSGSVGCEVATGCSGVFQFSATATNATAGTGSCTASSLTAWSGSICGVEAIFGTGSYPTMYDGSFDQSYYTAGTGKAGYLWECAPSNAGGTVLAPRLAAVAMQTSGSITPTGDIISPNGTGDNVTTAISSLSSNSTVVSGIGCSPVTEFYNTGNSSAVTTYTANISGTGSPTTITVGSNTGIAAGNYIEIGSEIMLVTSTAGSTSITVARPQLGSSEVAHTAPGNITIPAVDYLYLSVTENGDATPSALACTTGACLYTVAVGTASGAHVSTLMVPTNGAAETGGTSGIVIDNSGTATGESQIYFTPLSNQACLTSGGTGGCAIQASQSAP